jgi:hypothetical protein
MLAMSEVVESEPYREDAGDGPHGVPALRVVVSHAQAQPRVGLEPPAGRHHRDVVTQVALESKNCKRYITP